MYKQKLVSCQIRISNPRPEALRCYRLLCVHVWQKLHYYASEITLHQNDTDLGISSVMNLLAFDCVYVYYLFMYVLIHNATSSLHF